MNRQLNRWRFAVLVAAVALGSTSCREQNDATPADDAGSADAGDLPDRRPDVVEVSCDDELDPNVNDDAELIDDRGTAAVSVVEDEQCNRRYLLTSTADRRDSRPASPREVPELDGWPRLRSGNALVDGLYAMTMEEVRQNSVDAVSDGAFADGEPIDCPAGGCFETGEKWKYVWTRDISYALDLGLAALDPVRGKNSLMFKVSPWRDGDARQVMQDTGTGGGFPVSTDRVVWVLGAKAVAAELPAGEAGAFLQDARSIIATTLASNGAAANAGLLYRGEQSFLDWREQSYPRWVADDPVHIATSRSLSTNLLHQQAWEFRADSSATGHSITRARESARWMREAIWDDFYLDDAGLSSAFFVTQIDMTPSRQFDLLGTALAVLFELQPDPARAVASYPHYGVGAPVIFPQQQFTPIYHNRAEWPFVSAYWLRAAGKVGNDLVAARMIETLIRGAALNMSNMENWEAATGEPWVEDGEYSGPIVNSHRQLWSVAAFVSLVHQSLFGLTSHPRTRANSRFLRVRPRLPRSIREAYFAESERLVLHDYPYAQLKLDVVLHLPDDPGGGPGFYEVDRITVDGRSEGSKLTPNDLEDGALVEVHLAVPEDPEPAEITIVDESNWRNIFAPQPPTIDSVGFAGGNIGLEFSSPDEASSITWNVYKDGEKIAENLPGDTTSFADRDSIGAAPVSPCYVVETCFVDSGNCSQHSEPQCWWGPDDERIVTYAATAFDNVGGTLSEQYGKTHWSQWGDPDHTLTISGIEPAVSGPQWLQLTYGNGAGPVSTGITCGVKKVTVIDEVDDRPFYIGTFVMPHLGDWSVWGRSSMIPVTMEVDRTYRVEITDARNMSAFEHFARYSGTGGPEPFNRVNVAELHVLSRGEE